MRIYSLFLLAITSILPLSANNLVINGTFAGGCSGWTTSNTDQYFCQDGTGFLGAGNTGGWAAVNNAPTVIPSMSQNLSGLLVGATYDISFDMQSAFKCCGNSSVNGVSVAIDGHTWLFDVKNTDGWFTVNEVFTYSGGSSNLVFTTQLNQTDQDAGFDNIAVNQVSKADATPEPATYVLMSLPLAAMFLRRKFGKK